MVVKNQQVTFFTAGGEDIRELPQFINPEVEHILDWFHLTMRLSVLGWIVKGLAGLEQTFRDAVVGLEGWEARRKKAAQLFKAVQDFGYYIEVNQNAIPNYGDRYRNDETVSTAFLESAVNQVVSKRMVKRQQMCWTKRGAHLLLQIRTRVLNDDLRNTFGRWYPGMNTNSDAQAVAAQPPLCLGLLVVC